MRAVLAGQNIVANTSWSVREWQAAMNQVAIFYGDRFTRHPANFLELECENPANGASDAAVANAEAELKKENRRYDLVTLGLLTVEATDGDLAGDDAMMTRRACGFRSRPITHFG